VTVAPEDSSQARAWRVPPAQPAILVLVTTAAAALNIYGHPDPGLRAFSLGMGALCLGTAIFWLRTVLYVDDEGIAVRTWRRERFVPWSEVERVEVANAIKGGRTVRVVTLGGQLVDVPPSLLQPIRPTSKPKAESQLKDVVRALMARAPADFGQQQGDSPW
jgi:hypothetical protein